MTPLTVVCWKWGDYTAEYVNKLRRAVLRNLRAPHRFACVTDDPAGLDSGVDAVEPPPGLHNAPRCVRRLQQYDGAFARRLGPRVLSIDLDVVVVGDVTGLFCRPEPLALWWVGYARVYCGSPVLMDAGALQGLWDEFAADPDDVLRRARPADRGGYVASDQDVLNSYVGRLRLRASDDAPPWPAEWSDADGLVVNPVPWQKLVRGREPLRALPPGARVVFMGGAERRVMEERRYPWIEEHWV